MRLNFDTGKLLFEFVVFIIFFIILLPIIVIIVISFNPAGFILPPSGMTLKWYIMALSNRNFVNGAYVSFLVAIMSSGISTILGTITSFALVRYRFKGREFFNTFFMLPLIIPMITIGLSVFIFSYKLGIDKSLFILVMGHALITTPFSIRAISASLQNYDRSLEEAAINIGLHPMKAVVWITLPIIKVGIISGMLMCFIISWNNFTFSIFFTSPKWTTIPIELMAHIKYASDPSATAISGLLIFISFVFIILISRFGGLERIMNIYNKKA